MIRSTLGNQKGSRRGNRDGSGPFQRADGRWQYQLWTGQHDDLGRPVYKWVYGRTQQKLWDKVRKTRSNLERSSRIPDERLTLERYLVEWLANKKAELAPKSYAAIELDVRRYIVPRLGRVRVAQLTTDDVKRWRRGLLETVGRRGSRLSTGTVSSIVGTLRNALNDAVGDGWLARNPAAVGAIKVERAEAKTLTLEQARRLIVALRGHADEAAIRLTLSFGPRQGEVLGLRREDVDLASGRATLAMQIQRIPRVARRPGDKPYQLKELKTGRRGRRTLPLWPSLVDLLERQLRRQDEWRRLNAGVGWGNDDGLIFTTVDGRPIDGVGLTKRFQRLLAAAGLPRRTFHELRHSSATIMLAQGVTLDEIRKVLGHTDRKTTEIYAHLDPAIGQATARMMEMALEENADAAPSEQLGLFDAHPEPLSEPLSGGIHDVVLEGAGDAIHARKDGAEGGSRTHNRLFTKPARGSDGEGYAPPERRVEHG